MDFEERKQEGIKFIREDNYQKAFEIFSQLFYEDPKNIEVLEIAQFLFGRITDGYYDFRPESAEEFVFRGVSRFYKSELEESIEDFDKAIELDPKSHYSHKCKAFSLMHLEQYTMAIVELNKALAITVRGEYYDDIAENLSRMGLKREAIPYHQKAVETAPEDPRLWYNYGTLLGDLDMVAPAVEKFLRALELYPQYEDAQHNLNYYYNKLKGQ